MKIRSGPVRQKQPEQKFFEPKAPNMIKVYSTFLLFLRIDNFKDKKN